MSTYINIGLSSPSDFLLIKIAFCQSILNKIERIYRQEKNMTKEIGVGKAHSKNYFNGRAFGGLRLSSHFPAS